MSNTITAFFKGRVGVAEAVYQNDYGIVMNFDSIELPAHFDCYFSVMGEDEAIPGIGADNQVVVPNGCLSRSGSVTLHIPLHTGANDSEVEYIVYFKVIGRARPVDDGTPVQMTAIEQALALLQNPIGNIEQIVNEALSFTGDTFAEMKQELQDDFDNYTETLEGDLATWKGGVESDIDDVEHDFTVLQNQFDTAVAAVTTDTEVTDIRVGADGVTDTTAGASVRRQFTNLKSDISQAVNDLGGNVAYEVVTGKSVVANVGGVISFPDSANRMYLKFNAYKDFTIKYLKENVVRMALITGDASGRCIANTGWDYYSIGHVTANPNYIYYLLCDFTDTDTIPSIKYDGGLIVDAKKDEQRITNLEFNVLAQKNGYYSVVPLEWENGAFNIPSGTNNDSANVIRTPLPRLQFTGDIKVLIANDKYRFRIIGATDATSSATYDSGWYWDYSGEYTLNVDPLMYYRIQIATKSASSMDKDEALQSLLFVYADESMSVLKSFWDSYIESKVQTINSYMTDGTNKTAFLFLTDTHWNESPSQLNSYGINSPLMRYVKDRCNIDYVIHGGDLNSEYRSNRNIARELMTKPMALMRDAFGHVLVTRGNHDDNNEGGNDSWNYTITQSDSYSYMFRNTKDVVFGETGTYFYHDIPFEKVRIISLDCVDFPYTNDVDTDYLDEKLLAYGHTQLQWLCDTLKSTPSGYHIVIYTHAMIAPSIVTVEHPNDSPQTRAKNSGVVARILQAYKNRTDFSLDITGWFTAVHQSYYDGVLSDDFSNCSATIVGVFSGHEHIDCIEEIEVDGTGIGIYNTCTQNSSAMFGDSVISHSYQHPMEIGTTSELVWDMVVIDRANKHVDMIRIGANGANTDVEAFDVRSFDYV